LQSSNESQSPEVRRDIFAFGPTGIKTGASELGGRTVVWNFDGIYRLTSETVTNDPSHEDGSVSYALDPVGNRLQQTSTQFDPDLGLYYLRARYYNPLTGRFMSRDPREGAVRIPAELHRYLYSEGDPVDSADPSGRDSILETGDIDLAIGERSLPALSGLAGATAESAVEWFAALDAEIAEINENLVDAASDFADGLLDAAGEHIDDAVDMFNELVTRTDTVGGLTKLASCEILGTVAASIADHAHDDPKIAEKLHFGVAGACSVWLLK
jgi:RHS repeat-associated protein